MTPTLTPTTTPEAARRCYDELLTDAGRVGWLEAGLTMLLTQLDALSAAGPADQLTQWHTTTRHAAFLAGMLDLALPHLRGEDSDDYQ